MPWNMRIEIGFSWNATFRSTHTQPIHLLMLTCPFLLFRDWSPIPQLCQDNSKNYNEQCQNCLNHPETCHIIYLLVVAQRKNLVIPCFSSIHLGIKWSGHPSTNATKSGDELELSGSPAKTLWLWEHMQSLDFWMPFFQSKNFPGGLWAAWC